MVRSRGHSVPAFIPEPMPEVRTAPAPVNVHDLVAKKYDQAISDAEVVSYINANLATTWKDNNVQPSPPASDEEWCRRVYLRVLGRIPTVEEVRKFAADKTRDKREKLVTRLMEDDGYAEQFAPHWASVWTNLLIGRTGGARANAGQPRRAGAISAPVAGRATSPTTRSSMSC